MRKPWEAYRQTCMELDKPDPGDWRPHGPIFLWVTTDDKQRAWERLAPHIRHQIDSYGAWTKAGLGKATGPYIPSGDLESLSQDGAYQVVTPDEAVELAHQLGPAGELHLNPLLAGIHPDEAWRMLRTFERDVLPHLGPAGTAPPRPGT